MTGGGTVRNPLRFDADGLALALVEGGAASSMAEAGRLRLEQALAWMVRLQKRSDDRQKQIDQARARR